MNFVPDAPRLSAYETFVFNSRTLPPILTRRSRRVLSCIRRAPLSTSFLLKVSNNQ